MECKKQLNAELAMMKVISKEMLLSALYNPHKSSHVYLSLHRHIFRWCSPEDLASKPASQTGRPVNPGEQWVQPWVRHSSLSGGRSTLEHGEPRSQTNPSIGAPREPVGV
ncbi:MAG: hypothetical protein Q9184_002135 [Pyrenodesmia sp. 2 TL-2023]